MEIPGYRILREIGAGGMATVYLAVQENLGREVALKVMTPGLSVDETYCHRFLKEGRIAAQLNHRNLLTVHDIGTHEDHYYMAAEYLPAGTVRSKMAEGLTTEDIVNIVFDIAQGLGYVHQHGFVHRDVKPGNMLFRADGTCVLGDFGIAKSVHSNTGATKLGTSIGTPHYMSPEQARGEKVDHRTDLYSLGVCLFEMLTGRVPFDADDPFEVALAQINDTPDPLPEKYQRFQSLIDKLLSKDRNERYAHAEDFIADLEQVAAATGTKIRKPLRLTGSDAANRGTRQRSSASKNGGGTNRPAAIAIAATLALTVVVILFVLLGPLQDSQNDSSAARGEGQAAPDPQIEPEQQQVDPPQQLPEAQETGVRRELARAREHLEAGRLIAPPGENAYESFRKVQQLAPDEDAARVGLTEVANALEQRAENLLAAGQLDAAADMVSRARSFFPNDQGLSYLAAVIEERGGAVESPTNDGSKPEETIETETPVASQNPEVAGLISRADAFFDDSVYAFPPGENAADLYLQVLEYEPQNQHALQRLDYIAGLWARVAEKNLREGKLERARAAIVRGLEMRPGHTPLRELAKELDAN